MNEPTSHERIYCTNCKWFTYWSQDYGYMDYCNHPSNFSLETHYTHVASYREHHWKQSPAQKNSSNQCSDHETRIIWIDTPTGIASVVMQTPK